MLEYLYISKWIGGLVVRIELKTRLWQLTICLSGKSPDSSHNCLFICKMTLWNSLRINFDLICYIYMIPGGSDGKASAYNVRDPSLIPGSGRSPGEGNGNPFQYSCLENPTDRRVWSAIVHGVTKSQTWLKWLSTADILTEIISFDNFLSFFLSCTETWKSVLQIIVKLRICDRGWDGWIISSTQWTWVWANSRR